MGGHKGMGKKRKGKASGRGGWGMEGRGYACRGEGACRGKGVSRWKGVGVEGTGEGEN